MLHEELPLPPRTRAKGKEKMGQSVWANPTTALGRAHNAITKDKLKALSSVLLHRLVSCHIQKMLQVRVFFVWKRCSPSLFMHIFFSYF